jgi:predicted RND superfamily exporter protein
MVESFLLNYVIGGMIMKGLFSWLVIIALIVGVTWYNMSNDEEAKAKEEEPQLTEMDKALKKLKHVEIEKVTDARSNTGHVTVVVKLDKSIGEGTQVANVLKRTDSFVEALEDTPKTVTIRCMYKDSPVFQFTKATDTGELVINKATPYVERYLKKQGHIQ